MAAPRKGSSGRKVKDKWKAKEWYKVRAPRMFNETEIGETPAADPEYLIGRTSEVTVQDLTGDLSKMHIKLKFKINEVEGYDAKTVFVGHDLTVDYVRRLTRRKKTKTDHVVDVVTKDGFTMRLKTMSIAEKRIQTSQEEAMRRLIGETLTEMGKEKTVADFVKEIVSGDLSKNLAKVCREVVPVKRIEIRRSEILGRGGEEPESIIETPAPEESSEPEPEAETESESETEEKAEAEKEEEKEEEE